MYLIDPSDGSELGDEDEARFSDEELIEREIKRLFNLFMSDTDGRKIGEFIEKIFRIGIKRGMDADNIFLTLKEKGIIQ